MKKKLIFLWNDWSLSVSVNTVKKILGNVYYNLHVRSKLTTIVTWVNNFLAST
jgi:hypothetical protein